MRGWIRTLWVVPIIACTQDFKVADIDDGDPGGLPDTAVIDTDPVAIGEPLLQVAPLSVDFGYVPEGSTVGSDVTLSNVGDADLEVSRIGMSGSAAFSSGDEGETLVLPPGASVLVGVDFLSTADSELGALDLLTNDATLPSVSVPLRGNGEDPRAEAPALDFGFVHVDTTASASWPVDNPGNKPVTVTAVSADDPAFEVLLVQPVTIDAGGSANVEVQFTPTDIVPYAGTLTIVSDARVPPGPVDVAGHGADDPICDSQGVPSVVAVTDEPFSFVGSGSSDPIGRPLTFSWTLTASPAGSSLTLPTPDQADQGPFFADLSGTYSAELVVTNDLGFSSTCATSVSAQNDPPDVDCAIDPDTVVATRDGFRLLGSGSSDPNGLGLTASWTVSQRPTASSFTLPPSAALDQGPFVVDEPGDYSFELVVTNDDGASSAVCEVDLTAVGLPPIAECAANPPVVIAGVDSTFLIGSGSSDPLGRALVSATWSIVQAPSGSALSLPPSTALDRGPILPDIVGDFEFQLVVTNDLGLDSAPCTVTVEARPPEPIAICDANPRSVVATQGSFELLGRDSYDPAGRPLTATWSWVSRPSGSTLPMPGGAALDRGPMTPDVHGSYVAELVVTNDYGESSRPCQVTVTADALPPIAWCSADPPTLMAGETFDLLGDASFDPLGLALVAARWSFVAVPTGSSVRMPGGTAPNRGPITADLSGTYQAELVVTNSAGLDSAPCMVTVTAGASPPVAECSAVPPVVTAGLESFRLIGDTSYDPSGAAITGAQWSFTRKPPGSAVTMPGGGLPNRGPITPDLPGDYTAQLVVTSATGQQSAPCEVTVEAVPSEPIAVCDATPRLLDLSQGQTFTFLGSGSYDPAGAPIISYAWTLRNKPSGSAVTMPSGGADRGPILADLTGRYAARLVVTNAYGQSSAPCDTFVDVIGTPPVDGPTAICDVNPSTVIAIRESATFRGNQSVAGGSPITSYNWRFVQTPPGSRVTMPGNTSQANRTVTPDVVGQYVGRLTVTDTNGNSDSCTATLDAVPDADLWIELTWDVAEDIDLHLLRNGGNRNTSQDCYYANCVGGLSWGAGGTADDPRLDLDDITGTGPENINIDDPEDLVYRIVVHDYFWGLDYRGPTTFTVRVYINGVLELIDSRTVTGESSWTDIADIDLTGRFPQIRPL